MKIQIDIPKEFENHFKIDRFAESFDRICGDIAYSEKHRSEYDSWGLAGNYEREVCQMLKAAFKNATFEKVAESNDIPGQFDITQYFDEEGNYKEVIE